MKKLLALAAALALLCAAPAGAVLAADVPDSISADKIDQYLLSAMKAGKIPGLSAAIVRGDEVVYLKGFGNAGGGRTVTPQTPFTVCSVGKTFTALAIRQLAGQGKLSYDSPVQAYIPWFTLADPEAAKQITIGDLVGHRSGLSRQAGTAAYTYNANRSIEDVVRSLKDVLPDRPVGQTEEYSNLNFIILGLVVEKVSGMSYGDYVQKNIFDPLGMANSFTDEAQAKRHGSATGHSVAFGLAVPANMPFPKGQMPAGYQLASAEDMAKFAMLYLSNGYVGGKSIIENNPLEQRKPPYDGYMVLEQRYNIYWMPTNGPVNGYMGYYGHEGGTSNFTSMLLINPATKTAIVVLANCNNGSSGPVLSAATIAGDLSAYLETGRELPTPAAGFALQWVYAAALAAVVALLTFRALGTIRFPRSLAGGGRRRAFTLASSALLDGALPLAVLMALPPALRATWPLLLGAYVLPASLILLASAALLAMFAAKTVMLLVSKRAERPTETVQ